MQRSHKHVRHAYAACHQAVSDELARHAGQNGNGAGAHANGHSNGTSNGNGAANGQRDKTRPATASQIRAIHAIGQSHGIELTPILREQFGVYAASDLSITEASRLIDELNVRANGQGAKS
jgi:hypothetical protein